MLTFFFNFKWWKIKRVTLSYEIDPRLLEPVVLWADFGQVLIVALGSVCPGGWHFCILAGHHTPHSQQQAVLSWTCCDQWKGIFQVALGKTLHFLLKAHIPSTWIPYPIYISLLYNLLCSKRFLTKMTFNDIFNFK